MIDSISITFLDDGVSAQAALLWDRAPSTCSALIDCLPIRLRAQHGIYSGSEIAALLPAPLRIEPEAPTSDVSVGDVGFAWLTEGSHYGVSAEFAEICWFYDLDARPSMWEGPVPVTIFAQIDRDAEFLEYSRTLRLAGAKRIEVRA